MATQRVRDKQKLLKQRIVDAYSRPGGWRYIPSNWIKNLFGKPSYDIYRYILDRFGMTDSDTEYYTCMVFLYKRVPNAELLIEWRDSPNFRKIHETYKHIGKKSTVDTTTSNEGCAHGNSCTDELDPFEIDLSIETFK